MFSKCHFFVLKIKRNFFAIIFLLFSISLLLFSKNNLPAVKSGLILWANSVVPSLFPFFVATELLMHTTIIDYIGKKLKFIMKPLFNINGAGAFCFIMGLISGYPVGAKIACKFREENICAKSECERLLSFTNNSRSFIYNWYCWNKYVWKYNNRNIIIINTYISMYYCWYYF